MWNVDDRAISNLNLDQHLLHVIFQVTNSVLLAAIN
jgi:hypothetical protein